MIMLRHINRIAANEAEPALASNEIGTGFEIQQADSLFVPFGEFRHARGLQVFDRASAEAIANDFNGLISRLGRQVGLGERPVFIGHPDVDPRRYPDTRSYGWVRGVEVAENGMRLAVKWTEAGRELIEEGSFRFYSPVWAFKASGAGRIAPTRLVSVGLTNTPNIPVPAIANESDAADTQPEPNTETTMLKKLLALLGLAEDADETAVENAVGALKSRCQTAENEATSMRDRIAAMEAERDGAKSEKEAAETKAKDAEDREKAANDRVAALLTERATGAVESLVAAGHVAANQREALLGELVAANDEDYAARIVELRKQRALPTTSRVGDLGGQKSELVAANAADAPKRERQALVRSLMEADPGPAKGKYERAFNKARQQRPELFT